MKETFWFKWKNTRFNDYQVIFRKSEENGWNKIYRINGEWSNDDYVYVNEITEEFEIEYQKLKFYQREEKLKRILK